MDWGGPVPLDDEEDGVVVPEIDLGVDFPPRLVCELQRVDITGDSRCYGIDHYQNVRNILMSYHDECSRSRGSQELF